MESQPNTPPVTVEWGNPEKQYLVITFHSPWTWADFRAAYVEGCDLIRSVDTPVDLITDVRAHSSPPDSRALQHIQWVWLTRPANLRRVIVVGQDRNRLMRLLIEAYHSIVSKGKNMVQFVDTMEEALAAVEDRQAQRSS